MTSLAFHLSIKKDFADNYVHYKNMRKFNSRSFYVSLFSFHYLFRISFTFSSNSFSFTLHFSLIIMFLCSHFQSLCLISFVLLLLLPLLLLLFRYYHYYFLLLLPLPSLHFLTFFFSFLGLPFLRSLNSPRLPSLEV